MTGEKNRFKTSEKLWDLDDKQLKTPKHDAMVLWLMDKKNLRDILEDIHNINYEYGFDWVNNSIELGENFSILSEVPLTSGNGFINGYADLIVERIDVSVVEEFVCPLSESLVNEVLDVECVEEMESLLKSYLNDDEFVLKNDNAQKYFSYNDGVGRRLYGEDNYKLLDFVENIDVELPPCLEVYEIPRWVRGDVFKRFRVDDVRALIEVKPFVDSFGGVLRQIKSYSSFWKPRSRKDVICLFTLDSRFDSQFESQGVHVLHPSDDFDVGEIVELYGL